MLILVVGALGGIGGTMLLSRPLPPLNPDREQLITTVEEVTISPNMAASTLVERYERSVMLIVDGVGSSAIGTVVT
ncbi:MAG: hypothetical protein Q8R48_01475, partial [Candidatus Omnitrophota bacterium]|nr:hypothetical protein [Candidatus Omnitrophota bacterium]